MGWRVGLIKATQRYETRGGGGLVIMAKKGYVFETVFTVKIELSLKSSLKIYVTFFVVVHNFKHLL